MPNIADSVDPGLAVVADDPADVAPSRPIAGTAGRLAWAMLVVAVLVVVVGASGIRARSTYGAQVSSDEPQYLLTAMSLADDGDLDIADEIAARAYLPFHEIELDRQTIALDDDGQELSPHDPLLPVLLAAPMALGGWVAARALLVVVAAVTAALAVWTAVRRFDVDPVVAAVAVGAVSIGAPMAAYSTQVFPEMPAALALVALVAAGTARPLAGRHVALVVLAATALAWLSVKYVPVAAVASAFVLWPLVRDRRWDLAAPAGVALAGSALVYLLVHQRIYGGWTVYAAGDHFVDDGEFAVVGSDPNYPGRARRLVGLLVDRRYGMIPWAPIWLLAPVAVAWLATGRVRRAPVLVATITTGWLIATFVAFTMHGWWSPGRQIVVVTPLVAIAIALLVGRVRALLPPTIVLGAIGAFNWVWLAVEASTDRRTIIVDFHETSAAPYRAVAWLFAPGVPTSAVGDRYLVAWAVAIVAATGLAMRRLRRAPGVEASG